MEPALEEILVRRLARLTTPDDEPITEAGHADCDGNVAWVDQEYVNVAPDGTVLDEDDDTITDEQWEASSRELRWVVVYGCDNPTLYGHKVDGHLRTVGHVAAAADAVEQGSDEDPEAALDAEREEKRQERRRVIANNKAWDTATEVRNQWVKDRIVGRKSLPKDASVFIVEALQHHTYVPAEGPYEAREIGWLPDDQETWLQDASDNRAQVVGLVLVLASYERQATRDAWRTAHPCVRRYLTWLHDNGYTLAPVERLAVGLPEQNGDEDHRDDKGEHESPGGIQTPPCRGWQLR